MSKLRVSVTLDANNLLWLTARAAQRKRRSVSDTLDEVVTAARTGGLGAGPIRSVVGTVSCSDEELRAAQAHVRTLFKESLARSLEVREPPAAHGASRRRARVRRIAGQGQSSRG